MACAPVLYYLMASSTLVVAVWGRAALLMCKYGDVQYRPGTVFQPISCRICLCDPHGSGLHWCAVNGRCRKRRCWDMVVESGQCCGTCPSGPNCYVNGTVIALDQTAYIDNNQTVCACKEMSWGEVMPLCTAPTTTATPTNTTTPTP